MKKGYRCNNCGKGIMIGHNVSHAKNRVRRIFKPNLHTAKLTINGTRKTLRLCTKCLRRFKNAEKSVKTKVNLEPISTSAPTASSLV